MGPWPASPNILPLVPGMVAPIIAFSPVIAGGAAVAAAGAQGSPPADEDEEQKMGAFIQGIMPIVVIGIVVVVFLMIARRR